MYINSSFSLICSQVVFCCQDKHFKCVCLGINHSFHPLEVPSCHRATLMRTSPPPFVSSSWDNIHLRARRSPHHIYLATQWPAEHTGRPAGSGLQHAAEGSCSGQGGERQGTGRLPGAAHSKILLWGQWWGDILKKCSRKCYKLCFGERNVGGILKKTKRSFEVTSQGGWGCKNGISGCRMTPIRRCIKE